MPENNKCSTPRLLIAALGLTAGLAMAPQSFAGPMSNVTTSAGERWMVSGECLKSMGDADEACGEEVVEEAKPAPVKPAPRKAPPKLAPSAAKAAPSAVNCDTTVNFAFDRSALKADMKRMLDEMANKVKASPASEKVMIVGHTDSVGTEGYNIGLSNRRAKAVADYLAGKGVSATSVTGEGESNPVAPNSSSAGRAENRRAEVSCK
jgi:outer membrane protein OmpA-like peptidoglycan-associated protein